MKQNLSLLMEAELEKAELILAAKNLSNELQKMVEDIASMRVDDLLPLVDQMKEVFGRQEAERYQSVVDGHLESLQQQLTKAKGELENASNTLNGEPSMDTDMDLDVTEPTDMDLDSDLETGDVDDVFGADDTVVGDDEPLGRSKKESLLNKKRVLEKKLLILKKKIAESKKK